MASLDLSKDDSLYTADFEAVPPSPTDAKSSPSDPHAEQNAEDFADIDSGHEVDIASSTESIESSHYLFEKRNGRTYHSYKSEHNYVLPNDALEQDRLDMQFWGIHEILEKYIFAPIGDTPQAILDVGTGTGLWAMDVGDLYPSAQIIGTDLSPIQPAWVPPNVQFELHDCTQYPWDFRRKFDLIHTQLINAFAVKNWRQFYTEAYDNLTPGGWIESHEFDLMVQSDDDSIPKPQYGHKMVGGLGLWCRGRLQDKWGETGRGHGKCWIHQRRFERVSTSNWTMEERQSQCWPVEPSMYD